MHRSKVVALTLICASGAVGWAAWSGHVLALPFSIAFPALWSLALSRGMAALVSVAYFLAASRGLPQGVAAFYASDLWPGLLLWLFASSAFVLVHSVLWTKRDGWRRAVRFSVACGLMTIPPFGIVGWAHPLNAAGVLVTRNAVVRRLLRFLSARPLAISLKRWNGE